MVLKLKYKLRTALVLILLISTLLAKEQEKGKLFTFKQISEKKFKKEMNDNFNAKSVQLTDSVRLENALQKIDKTYSQDEIDLAHRELCESPRCLTSFKGYFPDLDILVFYIQDLHFEHAVFIKENNNFPYTRIPRYYGSYGVMSKNGRWVGLKRRDCDNYLQIEICAIIGRETSTIVNFNFATIDINTDEKVPIFWVNENTIYLATIEYNNTSKSRQNSYYEIKFDY